MRNRNRKLNGQMERSRTKGKRKNGKDQDRRDDSYKAMDRESSPTNDVVWYAQTPELLQLAANIPFSQATGTKFSLSLYNDEVGAESIIDSDLSIPGIMTLAVIPCPSDASSPNSPLNIAATSVYSFVRHANSGTPQYDAPDLMLYCIAMSQVYSYINYLQRVYGCMNLYANMNRYLPRALVQAQNVDFDSVLQNLPNFKYGIDALIHKAASLACPASMTYFQRCAFMFSGLYSEGETVKDQLYMYIPQGFMQYQEVKEETGGSLSYVAFRTSGGVKYTYQELLKYGNELLDPIISSQDMNIMSGDILKAYGSEGILKLALVPDNYMIMPTTDLTVLEQFQNSGFTRTSPNVCKIVQSQKGRAGHLISTCQFPYQALLAALVNGDKVLTTILTNPGPGDVIERTRLMLAGESSNESGNAYIQLRMATELPCYLLYTTIKPDGTITTAAIDSYTVISSSTTQAELQTALNVHCILENFKFHPAVYYFTQSSTGSTLMNMALDFDNYAIVNYRDLVRMNEAALLSMFNVNSVAKAY